MCAQVLGRIPRCRLEARAAGAAAGGSGGAAAGGGALRLRLRAAAAVARRPSATCSRAGQPGDTTCQRPARLATASGWPGELIEGVYFYPLLDRLFALPPSLKQRVRAFKMHVSACDARARPARLGRRAGSLAAS